VVFLTFLQRGPHRRPPLALALCWSYPSDFTSVKWSSVNRLGHRHSLFGPRYHALTSCYFEPPSTPKLRAPFLYWARHQPFSLDPAYQQPQTPPTRPPQFCLFLTVLRP